jgi:hypothetical protein
MGIDVSPGAHSRDLTHVSKFLRAYVATHILYIVAIYTGNKRMHGDRVQCQAGGTPL